MSPTAETTNTSTQGQTILLTLPALAGTAVLGQSTGRCCRFWQACWITATGICQMQPTHRMCPAQRADLLQRSFILEFYGTRYKYQLAMCDVSERKRKAQGAVQITRKHPPRAAVGCSTLCACLEKQAGSVWHRDARPGKQRNAQRHFGASRAILWLSSCQKISIVLKTIQEASGLAKNKPSNKNNNKE